MRHCEICQKTSKMAGTRKLLRGHYNPTNWTRKHPNLQKTCLPNGRRVLACTACMRTQARVEVRSSRWEARPKSVVTGKQHRSH